jgi:hypothetical protein
LVRPRFFATPAHLRKWFEENQATARELWVGYFKKGSGKPSVTWPESVDETLCVGWIDGIRKSVVRRVGEWAPDLTVRRNSSAQEATVTTRSLHSAKGEVRPLCHRSFAWDRLMRKGGFQCAF